VDDPDIDINKKVILLKMCSEVARNDHWILQKMAVYLLESGKFGEALQYLNKAEDVAKRNVEDISIINENLSEEDQLTIEEIQKNLFAIYLNTASALNGMALSVQSELQQPSTDAESSAASHLKHEESLAKQNEFLNEALKKIEAAIELGIDNASAYAVQVSIFIFMKKFPEAIEAIKTALRLDPVNSMAISVMKWLIDKNLVTVLEEPKSSLTSAPPITDKQERVESGVYSYSLIDLPFGGPFRPSSQSSSSFSSSVSEGDKNSVPVGVERERRQEGKSSPSQTRKKSRGSYRDSVNLERANSERNNLDEASPSSSSRVSTNEFSTYAERERANKKAKTASQATHK
jgi:tetratricopeptide (TPR) repeat protein